MRDGALIEAAAAAYHFDARNNCREREHEAYRRAREVGIEVVFLILDSPYVGLDHERIVLEGAPDAQFAQTIYHRVRIVGDERVPYRDRAAGERAEKERAVGIALGARYLDGRGDGTLERSYFDAFHTGFGKALVSLIRRSNADFAAPVSIDFSASAMPSWGVSAMPAA